MRDMTQGRGTLISRVRRNGVLVDEHRFTNTILRSGRRYLAAAMGGNLLGTSHDAYIAQMAFGVGGLDGMNNKIPVPESLTTFVGGAGNIKDVVPAQCIMAEGDVPGITVVGTLPETANSNGVRVTQVGLIMANGQFYSIATWGGFDKDVNVVDTIEYSLVWL